MLFSQTEYPPPSSHALTLNVDDIDGREDGRNTADTENDAPDIRASALSSSRHQHLASGPSSTTTTSPTPFSYATSVQSRRVSSPDRPFSQLTITTQDASSGDVSAWSYDGKSNHTPNNPVAQHSMSTFHDHVSPSSSASHTFTFAVMSSPDSDDVAGDDIVPKVEEIDDNDPISILNEQEQNAQAEEADQPQSETAGDENDGAGNQQSAPPKRKRGRPRKHPLPVPGQAKVAKGRSKTGCITCRRRKKKCDETKPACTNCQKNAVVCEGYPVKEIWKSGKQKIDEARRGSFTSLPHGLPILIDGIESEIDRRFLDHFVYDFSRVLTLINDDSNPFKEILLPMATHHRGLMHSLMCLSGSHLSARYPEPGLKDRKQYHFGRAVTDLRTTIGSRASDNPALLVDDPLIASTIALCLNTICEGETQGEYRSHMDAARYLLATRHPQNEKFRQFIVEFFQYHDVSNSLTSLDRRPNYRAGDLRLPDFVPHAQSGAMLGIFDGLFQYISQITVIRDRIRQRINQGLEPAVDYETLSEAVSIDSAIRTWEPAYSPDHPNWTAAELYRQSTWVYLYRTIRPSCACDKISQVVDDGLLYLEQVPHNAGPYSILLMPLFLLGCSSFETRQRERIKSAFNGLQEYSSLRNITPSLQIVERVWEIMDTKMDESWDWEKIIEDMGMDFLIT